jgi:hypothetical protein
MEKTNDLYAIERLEGRRITAVVTDPGCLYSTYFDFAKAAGYPEAVASLRNGRSKSERGARLLNQTVRILAKGKHGGSARTAIYVVESVDGERFLFGADGLKITEAIGMVNEIEARYEKAVEQVREAIEELRLAALAKGYEDARRDLQAVKPVGKLAVRTPQEIRDGIIEQAKRDVAELQDDEFVRFNFGVRRLEFVINREKRTVVALLRGFINGDVRERGIAKCAPTDCFNAHIGKAIALRRALGLEVPTEYLNAPQPTKVRVGDVVDYGNASCPRYEVTKVKPKGNLDVVALNEYGFTYDDVDVEYKIIDDSREEGTN